MSSSAAQLRLRSPLFVAAVCLATPALSAAPEVVPPERQAVMMQLTLADALSRASLVMPSLRAARARMESAQANVREQSAALYPTLSTVVTGNSVLLRDTQPLPPPRGGLFSYIDESFTATAGLSLRWTVYSFGRVTDAIRAAEQAQRASQSLLQSMRMQIAGIVANAFVTSYYRQRICEMSSAALANREKMAQVAEGLVAAGLQPPIEVLRANSRVDAALSGLAAAKADLEDARVQLSLVLDLDPNGTWTIAAPGLQEPEIAPNAASARAAQLPQVASAQEFAASKRAAADLASKGHLPTLSLAIDGNYSTTHHETSAVWLNTRRAAAALTVSAPLFDASIGPNAQGARADAVAAEFDARQTLRDARIEAQRAAVAVRATHLARELAQRAALAAHGVFEVVLARYESGLGSPLDLLEAESADESAAGTLAQADLAQASSIIREYQALGMDLAKQP